MKVMSARAVKEVLQALAPEFTRTTGEAVAFTFGPVGSLRGKLAAGETADVVVLSTPGMDELEERAALVPESRVDLASASIGVCMRAGAAVPDIATPDAFKRAVLDSRAVAVSDPAIGGTAGNYLPVLFQRLGIAEAVNRKSILASGGGAVAEAVAAGKADLGITFISEMLPVPGISIVGPLPAEIGSDTTYAAAVMSMCDDPEPARAFIMQLKDPSTRPVWEGAGLVPIGL